MFSFDLVTSFPVSFFEIAAQAACDRAAMATGDAASSEVDGGQLRIIRVIKPAAALLPGPSRQQRPQLEQPRLCLCCR